MFCELGDKNWGIKQDVQFSANWHLWPPSSGEGFGVPRASGYESDLFGKWSGLLKVSELGLLIKIGVRLHCQNLGRN